MIQERLFLTFSQKTMKTVDLSANFTIDHRPCAMHSRVTSSATPITVLCIQKMICNNFSIIHALSHPQKVQFPKNYRLRVILSIIIHHKIVSLKTPLTITLMVVKLYCCLQFAPIYLLSSLRIFSLNNKLITLLAVKMLPHVIHLGDSY